MTDLYETATELVAKEELRLAAQNLQHLLKIQAEQVTLETITQSLQDTLVDSHAKNPLHLLDMMHTQAKIMDATFHYLLDQSKNAYTEHDKMAFAFKAQQASLRSAMAWKRLTEETKVKEILIKRTVQNAALDE